MERETPNSRLLQALQDDNNDEIDAALAEGADPTIRDKKKKLAEDLIGPPEKYVTDSYDPMAKERLVAAKEERELAKVAGRWDAKEGGRRRRI
jgi:hypothetical protein